MRNFVLIFFALQIICGFQQIHAQKSLQEALGLDDKKFEKLVTFDRVGFGYLKTFLKQGQLSTDQLPELKNVGLLSYILYDASIEGRADMALKEKEGVYFLVSESGGKQIVEKLYDESLPGIKKGLDDCTLLTPDEYLDSDEDKELYFNAEIKPTGLISAASSLMGARNDLEGNAVPKGYTLHMATFASPDVKLSRGVGDLAKKLDVDAFITSQVTFEIDKKVVKLTNIKMSLHVPNPAPYDPEQKYPGLGPTKGYWEGLCLGSLTFAPKSDLELVEIKKNKIVSENYEGIGGVFEKLTVMLMNYYDTEIEELKN